MMKSNSGFLTRSKPSKKEKPAMRSIFEIQIANKFSSVFVRLLGCLFLVIAFSGGNVFAQSNSNESKPSTKQETEKSSRRKTSGSTTQETAQPKTQPQPPQPPQTAQSATTHLKPRNLKPRNLRPIKPKPNQQKKSWPPSNTALTPKNLFSNTSKPCRMSRRQTGNSLFPTFKFSPMDEPFWAAGIRALSHLIPKFPNPN